MSQPYNNQLHNNSGTFEGEGDQDIVGVGVGCIVGNGQQWSNNSNTQEEEAEQKMPSFSTVTTNQPQQNGKIVSFNNTSGSNRLCENTPSPRARVAIALQDLELTDPSDTGMIYFFCTNKLN